MNRTGIGAVYKYIAITIGWKKSPLAYTRILFELLLFQELIQNAEDAGASQVKFLHYKHSHGTEKLHSDGLAQFQVRSFIPYFQNSGRPCDTDAT